MKVCGVFVTTVATLLLLLPPSTHSAAPRTLIATVERVSDGDTLVAITANQTKLRIRLLGIDAPEVPHGTKPGQPFGQEARDYLDHLIGGKTARMDVYGCDRYKRLFAVIREDQVIVNLLMVAMGCAEVYRGAPCQAYCQNLLAAEVKAKRDKMGMWALGSRCESPAAFRRRMRIRGE